MTFEQWWKQLEISKLLLYFRSDINCNDLTQVRLLCEKAYNEGYREYDEDYKHDMIENFDIDLCSAINDYGLTNLKNKTHKQFVVDMYRANLDIKNYEGRWFYKGPAVEVDSISEAMSKTSVPCNYDSMGTGFIVYPQ